jgi:hypothetical protein
MTVDLKWNSMRIPCGIEKKLIYPDGILSLEINLNSKSNPLVDPLMFGIKNR